MKWKISIDGMSCEHCVNHVQEALLKIGARDIDVSLLNETAYADFNEEVSDAKIKKAVEDAGYDVKSIGRA